MQVVYLSISGALSWIHGQHNACTVLHLSMPKQGLVTLRCLIGGGYLPLQHILTVIDPVIQRGGVTFSQFKVLILQRDDTCVPCDKAWASERARLEQSGNTGQSLETESDVLATHSEWLPGCQYVWFGFKYMATVSADCSKRHVQHTMERLGTSQ